MHHYFKIILESKKNSIDSDDCLKNDQNKKMAQVPMEVTRFKLQISYHGPIMETILCLANAML